MDTDPSEDSLVDVIEAVLERARRGEDTTEVLAKLPPDWRSRVGDVLSGYRLFGVNPLPMASAVPATIGPYRVLREVGRGGQAIVYLAEDPRLGRPVALKVLQRDARTDAGLVERFRREASLASRLEHPGICPVHDVGVEGSMLYIAMRFVEGRTLAERIRDARLAGDAGVPRTLEWIEQVARALHAAHERGVIHRDLKPGNVMVPDRGHPVILDFGLACDVDLDERSLTRTGDRLGTPAYMAPEQIDPGQFGPVDRRTDVWALGVTLFEALTLRRPFEAATQVASCHAILNQPLTSAPPFRAARFPRDLQVILATSMEKERERRYHDAEVFADDLRAYLERRPIHARRVSGWERAWRWARREPLKALLISVVLVVGLTAVAALSYIAGTRREVRAAREELRLASERHVHQSMEEQLELAFMRLGEQRHEGAVAGFTTLLAAGHGRTEVLAGMALARLGQRNPAAALEMLERHEETVGSNVALGRIRADALRDLGRRDEALALEESLPEPRSPIECFLMGRREERAMLRGDLDRAHDAIAWYQRAIHVAPRPRALYYFACVRIAAENDPFVARTAADALLTHWPTSAVAWHHAATALVNLDPQRAEGMIRRALELDPDFAAAHVTLGRTLSVHDERAALTSLQRAVDLDPDDYFGWSQLAQAANSFEQEKRAVSAMEKAVACAPDLVHLRLMSALYQAHQGKILSAMATVEDAVKVDPTNPVVVLARAGLMLAMSDGKEAVAQIRAALDRDPHAPQRVQMLLFDQDREVIGPALGGVIVPRLRSAIEQDSGHGFLHALLGYFQRVRGERAEALVALERAVEIDPRFAWGRFEYARVLELEGRMQEAEFHYREALALDPRFTWAALGIARTLQARGLVEQGLAVLKGALREAPLSWEARCELATSLLRAGRPAEALTAYAENLRLHPGLTPSHLQFCEALATASAAEDPARAFEITLELSPRSHWAHNLIAWRTVRFPGASPEVVSRAREHVTLAIERMGESPYLLNTLAVVQYRAGEFATCIETLDRGTALRGAKDATDELFLAMAHRRLGAQERARKHWKEAKRLIQRQAPHDPEVARCREEAEALFGGGE